MILHSEEERTDTKADDEDPFGDDIDFDQSYEEEEVKEDTGDQVDNVISLEKNDPEINSSVEEEVTEVVEENVNTVVEESEPEVENVLPSEEELNEIEKEFIIVLLGT